ncbi:uncharacterized protein LOC141664054 [Apium graveolens]|uniref:uncharacterized protein LOC141664054 n=1 Tax=Apium graveolens TaxID=4045 RepID=UPI003D7B8018
MDSSMDTDSETVMVINKNEAEGFDKPKRERHWKTPSQVDALEAAFTAAMYPSLAEMDELAEKIGLSESQVRMWFYHRRMKNKKEGSRKKSSTVSKKKRRMITYSSNDESESDTESDDDQLGRVSPGEFGQPSNATALTDHWGGSGTSDGRIGKSSKLKNIKLEYTPPEEAQSPHSQSLMKSTCLESHFFAHSRRASEENETSKKSLSNLEAELDDVQKKVQSAKKEVKDLKSKLEKDDLIASWRSEVTSLKAELAAAKVEKNSAAERFKEKIKAKNQEIEDLRRQLATERARHKEEKEEAYARFGKDVVALIGKFKAAA